MSLGSWGESQLRNAVTGFFGNPYVRDYTHASKTFRPDSYALSPKLKFLFHVVFNINPNIYSTINNPSVLVKTVKLPSVSFDVATLNQYNRKRLVQTKVKYDPIDITFHDDHLNVINGMWYRYLTWYYKDSNNPDVVFNGKRGNTPVLNQNSGGAPHGKTDAVYSERTQYKPSITDYTDWGYNGDFSLDNSPVKAPFFDNITIFGLGRHNWTSHTLINPIITRYGQDTYSYEQGNGTMENSMSIEYETVVYRQGNIDGTAPSNIIAGFAEKDYYDRELSPIAIPGSNAKILGQGGLVDAAGGAIKDLGNGRYLNAVRTAGVAYNTFKNKNAADIIQGEITKGLSNALNASSNPTRNQTWDIPRYGDSGSTAGTAGTPSPNRSIPEQLSGAVSGAVNAVGAVTSSVGNFFKGSIFNGNAGAQNPNPSTGQTNYDYGGDTSGF
jgi:hypothetical protein